MYTADAGTTLCLLHRLRVPEGWQDIVMIYKKGELDEPGGGIKPPPRPGAVDDEE